MEYVNNVKIYSLKVEFQNDILSILNRDGHLLSVDEQNKQLIQNSLDNLQRYIDSHGNNASSTRKKETFINSIVVFIGIFKCVSK